MATPNGCPSETPQTLQTRLSGLLTENVVSHVRVAEVLEQVRTVCRVALLQDIEDANTQRMEDCLWEAHTTVNNYFRKALAELRAGGNQKTVERRKLGNDYLKFIKSSQMFYRSYVKELALAYGGIRELERAAQRLNKEYMKDGASYENVKPRVKSLVVQSCHRTLIQLGDLSRYRETELAGKERNWGPATGFYDLAAVVYPPSGASQNQLAVMALADGNLFRATYHLHRALSTSEPYPQAEGNLKKAFYKITSAWNAGQLLQNVLSQSQADCNNHAITAWYLRMIQQSYRGKSFPERDELEREIMSQLSNELKKNTASSLLQKIVLTNMAAGSLAQERFQQKAHSGDTAEPMQSYLYTLHFNLQTFLTLLQLLVDELIGVNNLQDIQYNENSTRGLSEKVTMPMQKILPALRLYCAWLVKNYAVVTTPVDNSSEHLHSKFWDAYAKSLTLIANAFPAESLSAVNYMLEEEGETVGFKPLQCDDTLDMWWNGSEARARREEATSDPDIAIEMIGRVRIFLLTGLKLAMNGSTRLGFDEKGFKFLSSKTDLDGHCISVYDSSVQNSQQSTSNPARDLPEPQPMFHERASDGDHQEAQMTSMVDELVSGSKTQARDGNKTSETVSREIGSEKPAVFADHSFVENAMSSSSPRGIITAVDLSSVVRKYSPRQSPQPISPRSTRALAVHRGSAGSSRSRPSHSPASNHQTTEPVLNSPFQLPSRPDRSHNRSTSITRAPSDTINQNHTRMQSTDSQASNGISPGMPSFGPSLDHQSNSDQNAWPWNPSSLTARDTSTGSTNYDFGSGMSSSLLFGAGQSPWNLGGEERRRLSGGASPVGGGNVETSPGPSVMAISRTTTQQQFPAVSTWSPAPGGPIFKRPT